MASGQALAQLSTKRCRWISVTDRPFQLDTLTLSPGSVQFFRKGSQELAFTYDPATNLFRLLPAPGPAPLPTDSLAPPPDTAAAASDSVLVCYRVLPLNLAAVKRRRNAQQLESASFERDYYREDFTVREELFSTPGLNKTGSISRGISFGNTQNVFVNSNLNLQLEGKLSEDISITGTISDQNIPFQPEGNTQQLQQFDRIFLTLEHPRWRLTAGDVVLQNRPSNFLRFYKNVQGGLFEVKSGPSPQLEGNTAVALSVAKGKFASVFVPPIESVQGPYKLTGPQGERFIIVLAGSERVYLDGRLLTRGFEYDYVIDYNLAEITFTPRNLIIRNSRIRVDFEYSSQNYTRTIQHLSHYQNLNKLKLQFNFYNEADNPNQPAQADLSPPQRQVLALAGDSLDLAVVSGIDSVGFKPNLVLYEKIDSAGIIFYRYSTDPARAFFELRFTDMGQGNGDYVISTSSVNGRVYAYVPPVDGVRQGRYLPLRRLPPPTQRQLLTAGASYHLDKYTSVYVEGAASKNDLNRFSRIDADDDRGQAIKAGYAMEGLPMAFSETYRLNSSLSYEYNQEHFQGIDRFRDIEFERDWSTNLTQNTRPRSDNILNFAIGAVKNPDNLINYRVSRRYRKGQVNGLQHWAEAARQLGAAEVRASLFVLDSKQAISRSDWTRGELGIRYKIPYVVPGYTYRFDKNRVTLSNTDSLISSAIYFEEHVFFVQSSDSARTKYRLDQSIRNDRFMQLGELRKPQRSNTTSAAVTSQIGRNHTLDLLATYRELQQADSLSEKNVLTKADWTASFFDRHLRSELGYSIATGRELKRRYEFIPQLNGQGNYYWEDLNGDGRQQLDEFFLVQQPRNDTTYIKIFTPTDEYITAFTNRFTYRLNSSMPRNWIDKGGMKGFFARFSAMNFISIDKRTTDPDLGSRFNPFGNQVEEQFLIALNKSLRNTLYFNRTNPKYGIEGTWVDNETKQLLVNGTDTRSLEEQSLNIRYNMSDQFGTRLNTTRRANGNTSNYLLSRNFRIEGYELAPELSWQPSPVFRLTTTYLFGKRKNVQPGGAGERLTNNELGLESRISQVSKRTVTANLRYIRLDYTGQVNTVVGNELLNALRPGNNLTWLLNVQQRLSNGLNISLSYDGRKASESPVVHIGRMQVSVLF